MALVLVVDADGAMRRRILVSLRTLGHVAYGRENGRLALELLARQPGFEVVIARFGLPGMSGADFLRAAAMTVPSASTVLIADPKYDPDRHRLPGDKWLTILNRELTIDDLEWAVETAVGRRHDQPRELTPGGT